METWISGGSRRSIWGPNLKSPLSMTRETCRGIPTRAESHRNAVSQILSLLKILTLVLTGLICNDFFRYQESPFDGHKHTVKSVLAGPRQRTAESPPHPPACAAACAGRPGRLLGKDSHLPRESTLRCLNIKRSGAHGLVVSTLQTEGLIATRKQQERGCGGSRFTGVSEA